MIPNSLSLSQTPVYTARPYKQG